MKVSFTAKEYERLLELMWLGMQVAGGGEEDDAPPARYAELEQKMYELATPLGCARSVADGGDGALVASEELEEGPARQKLEDFLDDVFWQELVHRLAERDLLAELGATKLAEEFSEDEHERLSALEDRYWREFEEHGIDHLVLLRGGRG
ncbi:hypothetical protein K0B96_17060 [Horticoccus luteus]|uniref:Uncharacterized protein n=1 Tax=Horticoccus luteus TaxID=2862869 RepID=A0A8F9TTY5_9BACT|nr:hypothetical protein [Horticoccus luteus]QYM78990.1 hypothetical protein K0B96_17060 [Horticoccus luteus]